MGEGVGIQIGLLCLNLEGILIKVALNTQMSLEESTIRKLSPPACGSAEAALAWLIPFTE